MTGVYTVAEVRAAEEALMAKLPDGALMARAAYALSVECARVLGAVYGARVVLLVGAGNNGGDALYAGAYLARRGAQVSAAAARAGQGAPGRARRVARGRRDELRGRPGAR